MSRCPSYLKIRQAGVTLLAAAASLIMLTQCTDPYKSSNDSYASEEEIEQMGDHATRKQLVDQLDGEYLRLKQVYDEMYRMYRDNCEQIKDKTEKKGNITGSNKEAIGTVDRAIGELKGQNASLDTRMRGIEDIAARAYFIKHLHEYGIDVRDERMEAQINELLK